MQYAIETDGLSKKYRQLIAVRNLALQIPHGEIFGLLGPNGAGKTTAILMLLGMIRPTAGTAQLLGKPIGDQIIRRRIGFLSEKFQQQEFLTPTELLLMHGKLAGIPKRELIRCISESLSRVGLASCAGLRISELSRGMQQRIGLAQALLADPELIILDEPMSALDPLGRRDMREIIFGLRAAGKTVVLNSHLLSEMEMVCDRVAILHKGEMLVQGKVQELLSFASRVEVEVEGMNDMAMAAVRNIAQKLRLERVPITRFTVWLNREEDIPELAQAMVRNNVRLKALKPNRETLEDLFVRLVENKG